MKVCFVYPAFENLGIEYISAVLKENHHETFLAFDPQLFGDLFLNRKLLSKMFSYKDRILKQIREEKPDLIAFGIVSDLYTWASKMAKLFKSEFKDIPIVIGGPHVTAEPERVLKKPFFDYVVIGEGEFTTLELVEALENDLPLDQIKGLGYKDGDKLKINELRPLIHNLDDLPFADVELFLDQNPYASKEYNILTARGCVHTCSYCHNSMERQIWKDEKKLVRRRSIDNVIQELKERKEKYNFNTVCFWDEVFTYDVKWLEEFCKRYKEEIDVPFWAFVHPRHVTEKVVELLEYAGCWEVEIGIQTLNPWVKKEILNRPETKDEIKRAIKIFSQSNIRVVVDVIFGLPQLEEKDYMELIECFITYTPTKVQTFWLRYYPHTEIIDFALEHGILTDEELEDIKNGVPERAAASGGSKTDPKLERYQTALTLLPLLPKFVKKKLVTRNWVRFFPKISGVGHLLTRLLDIGNKNDVGARRYKGRMIYFTFKKMFPFFFKKANTSQKQKPMSTESL